MSVIMEDRSYTKTHEWVKVDDGIAIIGITNYAQHELGDIVYVDLPEEGEEVEQGKAFASIEAVKAVEEIISPVSGEITGVNGELEDTPELINQSPFDDGWIIKVKLTEDFDLSNLLTFEQYKALVSE